MCGRIKHSDPFTILYTNLSGILIVSWERKGKLRVISITINYEQVLTHKRTDIDGKEKRLQHRGLWDT